MTENEARKIMERATDRGAPLPNIVEYSEALRKAEEILGKDYTDEQLHNWILCGKYPFLILKYWNPNTRKYEMNDDYSYIITELDMMPNGWRIAFGELMCEELKEELSKFDFIDEFHFIDIKEKWGQLRIVHNGVPLGCNVEEILSKYQYLSENICCRCGKPDVPMTNYGWISPYCKECFITPSEWYKEAHPDGVDDYIKERAEYWDECNEEDNKMPDLYVTKRWSKDKGDEVITYDISETANKIRKRYDDLQKNNI